MLLKRIFDPTGVIPIERKILVVDRDPAVCQEISNGMKDDFTDVCRIKSAMEAFASYPGQAFSLGHLYAHVWDDEFAVNGEETVRVHIQKA